MTLHPLFGTTVICPVHQHLFWGAESGLQSRSQTPPPRRRWTRVARDSSAKRRNGETQGQDVPKPFPLVRARILTGRVHSPRSRVGGLCRKHLPLVQSLLILLAHDPARKEDLFNLNVFPCRDVPLCFAYGLMPMLMFPKFPCAIVRRCRVVQRARGVCHFHVQVINI